MKRVSGEGKLRAISREEKNQKGTKNGNKKWKEKKVRIKSSRSEKRGGRTKLGGMKG